MDVRPTSSRPTALPAAFLLFSLLLMWFSGLWAAVDLTSGMKSRSDVMGVYVFANEEQCRRMCWYRRLCHKYSYGITAPGSSSAFNCLLHVSLSDSAPFTPGWSSMLVPITETSSSAACRSRPCSDTEVCVPSPHGPAPHRACLPFPAQCGTPSVNNATLVFNATTQGHTANLTCDHNFTLNSELESVLTCSVTGAWTPTGVFCHINCQNGGVKNADNKCNCKTNFTGPHCERFHQDCTDLWNNGATSDGVYTIQPATSPKAFEVLCDLEGHFAPATYLLRHFESNVCLPVKSWADFQRGFGLDQLGSQNSGFFVGLDKMHQLTQQARYNVVVSLGVAGKGANTYYEDFHVGAENTSYELTYSQYYIRSDDQGGNGLNGRPPITFSSADNDPNNCSKVNGLVPGWYGADCKGRSFFNTSIFWPVNSTVEKCRYVKLRLKRPST